MKTNKLLSGILYFVGIGLIVGGFFLFKSHFENNIFELNLAVSLLVYSLFFIDVLFPWVNLSDSSHKEIGSLGIRWSTTISYALLAIGTMLIGNLMDPPLNFKIQLLIQIALAFFMLLGLLASYNAGLKVRENYHAENQLRNLLNEMKKKTANVHAMAKNKNNLPPYLKTKIEQLNENMRYLSPSNNPEASLLEHEYLNSLEALKLQLEKKDFESNNDTLEETLLQCEQIYSNRKNIYSV